MSEGTQHNAIIFETNGTYRPIRLESHDEINTIVGGWKEITILGRYPFRVPEDQEEDVELMELVDRSFDRVVFGQENPPALLRDIAKAFGASWIVDRLSSVMLCINDEGAICGLPKNPFFDDGSDQVLYGCVVMLLVHIDDI